MGRLLARYLEANPLEAEVLVPVPLHRRRLRERGYNQSKLLARKLGKETGIPVDTTAVHRTMDTPPQASTESRHDRRKNIEGAFECSRALERRRVLLIDDVVTRLAGPCRPAPAPSAWRARSRCGAWSWRGRARPYTGGVRNQGGGDTAGTCRVGVGTADRAMKESCIG